MPRIAKRLLGVLSGALVGYMFGWIWGWSLLDPNTDVWALTALVGAIGGSVVAVALGSRFWGSAGILLGSAIGLYVGWVVRTLLFGDVPGGWGLVLMLGGAIAGGVLGARPLFREEGVPLAALMGALVIGFFGGFLLDFVLLVPLLGLGEESMILWRAPGVIISGVIGAFIGAWAARRLRQPSRQVG